MYGVNLRPYGEYFAKAQNVTTSEVVGNQAENNPSRLDASQGGTSIVVATEKVTGSLTVANAATVTLNVYAGASAEDSAPVLIGSAVYKNDTGANKVFGPDAKVLEYILPSDVLLKKPYVSVKVLGSAAPTGKVDIFPAYVSHPRRG